MKYFIVFLLLFFTALLLSYQKNQHQEPLADAKILAALIAGQPIAKPPDETYGQFHGMPLIVPKLNTLRNVLGDTTPIQKHIEVDLARQRLYAFEENEKVMEFVISSGKWGRTPTGTFRIWAKIKSQLMSGGSGSDYYYLPNVPWVQFFYNEDIAKSRGFALHGTYWHNNFGHPMSHGCINMRTADAATLFAWTNPVVTDAKAWATYPTPEDPGTEIVIYGKEPIE